MATNPITTDIDFDRDGIQHGHLKLPHSSERAAWGAVMTPICVVRNGDGPTALMTGANHGDEYEGPVALLDLAANLDPAHITGRVIMVPMMNFAAFTAGLRASPLDGANMNRIFPGRADGTPTEKIADYFQTTLLPMADVVLDMHAGGKTLDFVPFAAAHVLDDKDLEARCRAAMDAFNAPYGLMMRELDAAGMYDTAAESLGKTFVTTELGGGGSVSAKTASIAKKGVANLLKHAGILKGAPEIEPSQNLTMPGDDCFVTADTSGLLELTIDPGDPVKTGDIIARIHNVERTGTQPKDYAAAMDGILIGRHYPGLTQPGDAIAIIAKPV